MVYADIYQRVGIDIKMQGNDSNKKYYFKLTFPSAINENLLEEYKKKEIEFYSVRDKALQGGRQEVNRLFRKYDGFLYRYIVILVNRKRLVEYANTSSDVYKILSRQGVRYRDIIGVREDITKE